MRMKKSVIALLGLAASVPAWAVSDFNDSSSGVSCQAWDVASGTKWKNVGGDWVDAGGVAQGSKAFRTAYLSDTNTKKQVTMDVTSLVKNWGSSSVYRGILIRSLGSSSTDVFSSREGVASPTLVIKYADGTMNTLRPQADSGLQCPWVSPIGTSASMTLKSSQNIVLRFGAQRRSDVVSAQLTLTSTAQYGSTTVGAFQMVQPGAVASTSTASTSTSTSTTTSSSTSTSTTTSPTTSTSTSTATTSPTTSTSTATSTTTSTSGVATSSNAKIYTLYDGSTGVTCTAWNSAAKLTWRNKGGDWIDANGNAQGSTPFAKTLVTDQDKTFGVSLDVTRLVQSWSSASKYRGVLLGVVPNEPNGTIYFGSRESSQSPVLTVKYGDGTSVTVKPNGDSHLDCTTSYAKGQTTSLILKSGQKVALSFDVPRRTDVTSATLQMTTTAQYGSTSVGAYQLNQPETGDNVPVQQGIAAAYPGDVGIENNPDVLFVERFGQTNFYQNSKWGYSSMPSTWTAEVISSDSNGFQNLSGNAYRIRINAGTNFGTGLELKTQKAIGYQPEELFFRYNLRFGSNFRDTADGGKMPGFASDTGGCGNGGRRCDGTDGWSLRGSFFNSNDPGNPVYPRILLGTYAYHADMPTTYGDHWPWQQNGLGMVEQNRWYSIEQYVKMNTVGQKNGIIKVWIDGKLAFQKTNLNLRTVSGWPIYKAWIDHYYGGVGTPSHNLGIYIDNIVLAKKYIGPVKR